jgi:hypothetical protein
MAMRAPLPQKLKEVVQPSAATRGESCDQAQENQRWETREEALRRPSRTMTTATAKSLFGLVLQHRVVHTEASADLENSISVRCW